MPLAGITLRESESTFISERILKINNELPKDPWAPLSGDYEGLNNGYIRLHCNFKHHNDAAVNAVLELSHAHDVDVDSIDKTTLSKYIRGLSVEELEKRVELKGGCAGVMRSIDDWKKLKIAKKLSEAPVVSVREVKHASSSMKRGGPSTLCNVDSSLKQSLKGVKVLDLTRVIAGPVCARTLAGHGATVLNIISPTLPTLPSLDIGTNIGKKSTYLNLKTPHDIIKFKSLVADADVLIQSYRPGALDSLGLSHSELWKLSPGLVICDVSAYGVPRYQSDEDDKEISKWTLRRGFDSLVQLTSGLAHEAGVHRAQVEGGVVRPVPLPCQALDHATGWIAAAGVVEALRRRVEMRKSGATGDGDVGYLVEASLARTSVWLEGLGRVDGVDEDAGDIDREDKLVERRFVDGVGDIEIGKMPGWIRDGVVGWELNPPAKSGIHEAEWW
ncbi:hypothetical protein HDU76_003390 [Blyttiomyces sp. JEL0837]|nr:hypothetical protein HDU76_003390 [Blyttiomyces sp. JEL0837]